MITTSVHQIAFIKYSGFRDSGVLGPGAFTPKNKAAVVPAPPLAFSMNSPDVPSAAALYIWSEFVTWRLPVTVTLLSDVSTKSRGSLIYCLRRFFYTLGGVGQLGFFGSSVTEGKSLRA